MHESALARQLVQAIVERVPAGQKALRVRGWLAETEVLHASSLRLHFDALAKGTSAEGATLDIALTHVRAQCDACGQVYLPEHHVTVCPECGDLSGTLLDRVGMGIDELDVTS